MSLDTDDVLDTTETRKKKAKKWVKFKIDERAYSELERMFGEGKVAKGVRTAVNQYLSDVQLPDNNEEKAVVEVLREFIPSGEYETEIPYETVFLIAKRVTDDDVNRAREIICSLKKQNYIRNGANGVRIRRRKFPDAVMEFLHGGV